MEAFLAIMQVNLVEILVLSTNHMEVDLVAEAVDKHQQVLVMKAAVLIKAAQVVALAVQLQLQTH
jgi:hypothetical protein